MRSQRVNDLKEAITDFSYLYVRWGLFERHKLIFSSLISFKILVGEGVIKEKELQYLIEGKKDTSQTDEH